jgi:hypothetical protein
MQEQEQVADQDNKPLAMAQLRFIDQPDGTMTIHAEHSPETFDPINQSHACLRAVCDILPEICRPAGTEIDKGYGKKVPITDGERYQAIRALAFLPEKERDALLATLGGEPQNFPEFDKYADKMVEYARKNPEPEVESLVAAPAHDVIAPSPKIVQ